MAVEVFFDVDVLGFADLCFVGWFLCVIVTAHVCGLFAWYRLSCSSSIDSSGLSSYSSHCCASLCNSCACVCKIVGAVFGCCGPAGSDGRLGICFGSGSFGGRGFAEAVSFGLAFAFAFVFALIAWMRRLAYDDAACVAAELVSVAAELAASDFDDADVFADGLSRFSSAGGLDG